MPARDAGELLERSPLGPALRQDALDTIVLHLNPVVRREQADGMPPLRTHARRVPGCQAGALLQAGFGLVLKLGVWGGEDRAGPGCTHVVIRSSRCHE